MIEMSNSDRKRAVNAMEYMIKHMDSVTIEQIMKDCNITFQEYRILSELMMPAVRSKSLQAHYRIKAGLYKRRIKDMNYKLAKANDALDNLNKYMADCMQETETNEMDVGMWNAGRGDSAVQDNAAIAGDEIECTPPSVLHCIQTGLPSDG